MKYKLIVALVLALFSTLRGDAADINCDEDYIIDNPELKGDYSTYHRYKRRCERTKRVIDAEEKQARELEKQTDIMEDEANDE